MKDRRDEPVTGDVIDGDVVRSYGWEWNDVGGPKRPEPAAVVRDLPRRVRRRCCCSGRCSRRSRPRGRCCSSPRASRSSSRGSSTAAWGRCTWARSSRRSPRRSSSRPRTSSKGPGVGTLCLGLAFLFIAAVRARSRRRLGLAGGPRRDPRRDRRLELAIPGFNDLLWPIVLVVLGGLLLIRARARARRRPRARSVAAVPAGPCGQALGLASRPASARSSASGRPSAIRTSSSSVITNGGPSRTMSPSTPFALPVPE